MEAKDKALKIAMGAVAILAVAMFLYYWIIWRGRTTVNDVSVSEKLENTVEPASEFAGVYSASEIFEGNGRRLNFFAVSKHDGVYQGSAKLSQVAASESGEEFVPCQTVKVGEPDFFLKCQSAELGLISFSGEWSKASGAIQASGKLLWSKDGQVVAEKNITLSHTPGG